MSAKPTVRQPTAAQLARQAGIDPDYEERMAHPLALDTDGVDLTNVDPQPPPHPPETLPERPPAWNMWVIALVVLAGLALAGWFR